jgi:hypothetical protein
MNRRSFLASSGVMLAGELLAHTNPAWATKRAAEKAHYALRIAPSKLGMQLRSGALPRHPLAHMQWIDLRPRLIVDGPRIERRSVHRSDGRRYRMIFRNGSGDQHPMHLHRHTVEVTRVGTKEFSGLRKDVVNVMPLDSVAVDFVADNPGDTLLHCHQALHMDFGFMQLMKYGS